MRVSVKKVSLILGLAAGLLAILKFSKKLTLGKTRQVSDPVEEAY